MNAILQAQQLQPFTKRAQFSLNMFVLFLAFPAFSVAGNSITFYIFLDLIFRVGFLKNINFKGRYLFLAFFVVGLLSSLFTPVVDRHPGVLSSAMILIQFLYWIAVASFVIKNRSRIDFMQLSKWMLIGTIIYIFVFFFLPINFKSALFSLEFEPGRNALVFNFLCSIPLSMYYIFKRWDKRGVLIAVIFFMFAMLATNGRAGAIIMLIESLLIIGIVYKRAQRYFRSILIILVILFAVSQTESNQQRIHAFSYQVDAINPRLGKLLRSDETGALKRDKSWLQRKLMISKGKEIFAKHPFIGVGPNNFKYYDSELDAYSSFDYLQGNTKALYNRRSAHNSYIQVLTEFGLIGFILFLIILLRPIYFFGKKFLSAGLTVDHLPIVCLIGISIHFYAISAFTGAIPWLIFGLCWALINGNNKKETA